MSSEGERPVALHRCGGTGPLQPAARAKAERVQRTASRALDRVKQETKMQGQAQAAAAQVKGPSQAGIQDDERQRAESAAAATKNTAKRSEGQVRNRASV